MARWVASYVDMLYNDRSNEKGSKVEVFEAQPTEVNDFFKNHLGKLLL